MTRLTGRAIAATLLIGAMMMGCGKDGDRKEEQTVEVSASHPVSYGDWTGVPLPKVLDFGRGKCIPCKKMAPILAELAEEYEGRAVIRVIDIGEPGGREMSREYDIRIIPTQIFLDAEGNEIWRHEGFLPKDEIVQKLREMGAEAP